MTSKPRFVRAALCVALPLLVACAAAQPKPQSPASATPEALPALAVPAFAGALGESFAFSRIVIHLQKPAPENVRDIVDTLRKKHFPELKVGTDKPSPGETPAIWAKRVTAEEMPPPSLEELAYFGQGLSPEQSKEAATRQHGVALLLVDDPARVSTNIARQSALVLALAKRLDGYIWDEDTRQLFTPEAFEARASAGAPSVLDHVSMHAYRNGELVRIVTLGMSKFGLPDVESNHVAAADSRSTGMLMNVLCALLIQGDRPAGDGSMELALGAVRDPKLQAAPDVIDGAARRARVFVRRTRGQEGDASETLLELFFGEGDDRYIHERRQATLAAFFGATDGIVSVEHDAEILAASARAKERLAALKPTFERGLEAGEHLAVKAPFPMDDGGDEWMWVEVVRWQGTTIDGILMNDPEQVSGLVSGSKVIVKQADVFDYIFTHADGSAEGNETGEILQRKAR
jgi:uncharacterized protein YegJ (DUF2314 family)